MAASCGAHRLGRDVVRAAPLIILVAFCPLPVVPNSVSPIAVPSPPAVVEAVAEETEMSNDADSVTVSTPLGALIGRKEGSVRVFRGIPFAEPPGRFEASVPKAPWYGMADATRFGDACFAIVSNGIKGLFGVSEDCLFANVWTPAAVEKDVELKLLPVVVFIHGGGFMMHSGSDPKLWGDEFAADPAEPVVYITFNYRLGIFGFLSDDEVGANFGIRDQQVALRWVQQNVAAFGGDPTQVTLIGQSAGAMSVYAHIVAPGSGGLFHRAFLASAPGLHFRNTTENEGFVALAAEAVACPKNPGPKRLECLRSRPAALLARLCAFSGYLFDLPAPAGCPGCAGILPWVPVVDGQILPASPLEIIRSGRYNSVPTVLSSVRNESLLFMTGIEQVFLKYVGRAYVAATDILFGDRADHVRKFYASAPDTASMGNARRFAAEVSDGIFTCFARHLARELTSKGTPAYLSFFMHAPSAHADTDGGRVDGDCQRGATCHAADLAWMFPQSPAMRSHTKSSFTDAEVALARRYSSAVRSFVAGRSAGFEGGSGVDNSTSQSTWVRYVASEDRASLWGDVGARVIMGYRQSFCDLMDSVEMPPGTGHGSGPWNLNLRKAAHNVLQV
eukprot:TRINITY_DN60983_c0_g1_i1.p1 TRINITY_DN60983_c0_g1~~TRINITY_DN60983_c0_g1_i1.p1  ORF type:complete len:636 (-),score=78.19 TRINITY_DN60983_c0_g1_i1:121-1974(-)